MRTVTLKQGIFSKTLVFEVPEGFPEFQIQLFIQYEKEKWIQELNDKIYDYCLN